MPELPEVETVKNTLKKILINKKIIDVEIYYEKLIASPKIDQFKKQIINQTINDVKRKGKWLIFDLDKHYLLSHLRMEGKYLIRTFGDAINKHEHIAFRLSDNSELRYQDTRKFGRMYLVEKEKAYSVKPLSELGLEPWDEKLTIEFLKEKYKNKSTAIKTVLLDQTIIVGIGNIYVNEILFASKINPLKKACDLNNQELSKVISNTKIVLERAINLGGTTIKSYTSSEGVHGRFQSELQVHGKEGESCPNCKREITKIKVNGRGTYYCPKCQK